MWEARSVAAIPVPFIFSLEPIAARSAPPTLNEFLSIISLIIPQQDTKCEAPHRRGGGRRPKRPWGRPWGREEGRA